MATYLVIKNNDGIKKSYQCRSTHTANPYLVVNKTNYVNLKNARIQTVTMTNTITSGYSGQSTYQSTSKITTGYSGITRFFYNTCQSYTTTQPITKLTSTISNNIGSSSYHTTATRQISAFIGTYFATSVYTHVTNTNFTSSTSFKFKSSSSTTSSWLSTNSISGYKLATYLNGVGQKAPTQTTTFSSYTVYYNGQSHYWDTIGYTIIATNTTALSQTNSKSQIAVEAAFFGPQSQYYTQYDYLLTYAYYTSSQISQTSWSSITELISNGQTTLTSQTSSSTTNSALLSTTALTSGQTYTTTSIL